MAPEVRSPLQVVERHCTELATDARIVAGMLWRYRAEFRTIVSYDSLVELALAEVWFVGQQAPTLTQTERVSRAMLALRRELRRSRAQLPVNPLEPFEENTLLDQLAQRDLLRRLQQRWLPADFADLVALCDDAVNCKDLARQRRPDADERELTLEHGRLRKLKRRLVNRARADLEELLGDEARP